MQCTYCKFPIPNRGDRVTVVLPNGKKRFYHASGRCLKEACGVAKKARFVIARRLRRHHSCPEAIAEVTAQAGLSR